ncbi:MAG: hypothetical protein QXD73_02945 [Candidatus Bathyarchaeia archaeon]
MTGLLNIAALTLSLVFGVVVGYCLRGKKLFKVERLVLGSILALIFSLGFSIGSNSELLEVMPSVWFNALVLLAMALFFSVLCTKVAAKLVKI